MARSSWRSSVHGGLVLALVAGATAATSAHRRDEYLQAARIAIDPERVQIEMDLTPGIAVADAVIAEIDGDRSGTISADEAGAYATRVGREIGLDVDGTPLALIPGSHHFPTIEAMRSGEGVISLGLAARLPALPAGHHDLGFRNRHRADIGVYLANVLIPASDRVVVASQRRDPDQRELLIDFELGAAPSTLAPGWLAAGLAAMMLATATVALRRPPGGHSSPA